MTGFFIAMAVCSYLVLSVGAAGQPYQVFPWSSAERVVSDDLQGLDCQGLWVARNEIYNRRGFCFATRAGQRFFDNSDCTGRTVALSRTEQANVDLIRSTERRRNCR